MTEPRVEPSRRSLLARQSWPVRAFALLLAGAAWLLPTRARGGESARLVYSRTADASSCADEQGLRQAVARRLGYDPFVAVSMNTVVAELLGDGDALKARVYVIREGNNAGGSRELSSSSRDCTELMAAVALAISIAVDPDALDRVEQQPTIAAGSASGPDTQEGAPTRDNATLAKTSEPSQKVAQSGPKPKQGTSLAPSNPNAAPSEFKFSMGVAPSIATSGPSPWPGFGAALFGAVRLRNWSLSLEPLVTLPSTSDATPSGAKARVWSAGGDLSGGRLVGPWYLGVVVDAIVLNALGLNVSDPKQGHSFVVSTGLRIGYGWQLSRHWSLIPEADGLFAWTRIRMQLNQSDAYSTKNPWLRFSLRFNYDF